MSMINVKTLVGKPKSRKKWLSEIYGGKWTYAPPCSWFSDDGRHVCRVCTNSAEDYDKYFTYDYFIYGGEKTERVDFNKGKTK